MKFVTCILKIVKRCTFKNIYQTYKERHIKIENLNKHDKEKYMYNKHDFYCTDY